MRVIEQTPAQQAQQAQQAVQQAQQAAQQADQAAQATERAIEQAIRNGNLSPDARVELKEQIRAAIDAAREATQQGAPLPPFAFRTGRGVPYNNDIPPQVPEILGIMGITLVCCVVGFPIARALARWIDRRGTTPPAASREVVTRLEAIEQAVESVAVEVERISEGQRFTTRVLSERAHEASPDFVPARDPVPVGVPANTRRN